MKPAGLFCLICFGFALTAATAPAEETKPLTIAYSLDIPPYVMKKATSGLEADIVNAALPDVEMEIVQMPYSGLQQVLQQGKADIAVCVREFDDKPEGIHFSEVFVYFHNTAASKKSAGLDFNSIAGLAKLPILAWEDANRELGTEFQKLFDPKPANYREIGDQAEQVTAFWKAPDSVIVIDKTIFIYMSRQQGHDLSGVEFHDLFKSVTGFRVAFRDEALRDKFNAGLKQLCANGGYGKILRKYHVTLPKSVCAGLEE